MASLNHVCMWEGHGWKRITAEEAAKRYPYGTIHADSGLFMCELCGQYVSLTNGSIRVRYFKHSRAEDERPARSVPSAPALILHIVQRIMTCQSVFVFLAIHLLRLVWRWV